MTTALEQRLEAALCQNPVTSTILDGFDTIDLPNAWLVAGCVAQTVWNLAAGNDPTQGIKDADIVYFDSDDLTSTGEATPEAGLRERFAALPIHLDVKNEARVHLWYGSRFGYSIAAYRSTEDAIASFPTTATAIGVRRRLGGFECCAPFGLDDLFAGIVRPNRRQITAEIYAAKVERWRPLWPALTYEPWIASERLTRP